MPTRRTVLSGAVYGALSVLTGCTAAPGLSATPGARRAGGTLLPYASENEFAQALGRWRTEAQKLQAERRRAMAPGASAESAPMASAPMPSPAAAPMALSKSAADARCRRVDHQCADRRRRRGRHRQAGGRLPGHAAPRPAVHGAGRAATTCCRPR
jgi:hypothetical protein